MTHSRSIFRGGTDYTGVSLENIYEDLIGWKESTEETIKSLLEDRNNIENNRDKFNSSQDILDFIDFSVNLFRKFSSEFDRLLSEIPHKVSESHIETILQIYNRSEMHDRSCVTFKNDNIERALKDEKFRHLLDSIYATTRDEVINYSDLSNVVMRLKALVGTSLNKSTSRFSFDDTEAIQLKPNIFGIGLDINYIIKRAKNLFSKKTT